MSISTIVLCAGEGTRMKGVKSKMLHELCGRPLCFYALEAALAVSSDDVVAVLGSRGDQVQREIKKFFGDKVKIVWQTEQLGTAHAVQQALLQWQSSSSTILVSYGDAPLMTAEALGNLHKTQIESQAKIALLSSVAENPFGYGRIVRDDVGDICGIVEENDCNQDQKLVKVINAGMYAFEAEFLRTAINQIPKSKKGEFYLTDIVAAAYGSNGNQPAVVAIDSAWQDIAGVNDRKQLAEARKVMQGRILDSWMRLGVTVIDPRSTSVDYGVALEEDVILESGVCLRGTTKIGRGAQIGAGSVLFDTHIGVDAVVLPYCVCEEAQVDAQAKIGPFSHLRKNAHVESHAHVGNFVELKNTTLKTGAKANHLAYLGDAEIGANSNVGAGTITCNYDGFAKHKTVLGDGVFIGSNATLVAPISIGDGAYIGAGSTIVQEVPKNALAIGRGRQETKLDYADGLKRRLKSRLLSKAK